MRIFICICLIAPFLIAQQPGARDLFYAQAKPEATEPGPLGLRYSLLKKTAEGEYAEVDADTWFRAGDAIRLSVEANSGGYLYVVQQGSSGRWSLLFGSKNPLVGGRRHEIPSHGEFSFDQRPGTEKLFIVLSRRPEPHPVKPNSERWLGEQARSRDLVREKVDEKEKANYVVNRNSDGDSRVVTELRLRHR